MNRDSLRQLEHHDAFLERHIGPNDAEIAQMLRTVGHDSLEALTDAIVPGSIKSPAPLALPESLTEVQALAKIPTDIEAKLDANMKLMDELELSATPAIFYLDDKGGLQQQQGALQGHRLLALQLQLHLVQLCKVLDPLLRPSRVSLQPEMWRCPAPTLA